MLSRISLSGALLIAALAGLFLLQLMPFAHSLAATDTSLARVELRVHDEQGIPVVARVRVLPERLTQRLRLARSHADLVIASSTGTQITLEAGKYLLHVSRGPEWSIAEVQVSLEPGDVTRREVMLRHEVSLAGFHAADLHVHTPHSDDAKSRGGVHMRDLQAEGVELAAITDHNHIGALGEGIGSVAGAEITTWAPEFGHFNAFPLRALPAYRGSSPAQLFAELARDPDVYVQVNHPRLERHIGYFDLGEFDGERFGKAGFPLAMHGVEIWNGYDLGRPKAVDSLLAEWRALLAQGHRLTATGGSDSHGRLGHLAGYPRTYVATEHAGELAKTLKAGRAFVSNGPLLDLRVNGKRMGEQAGRTADGLVRVELSVLAPSWMRVEQVELWAGEERVYAATLPTQTQGQPLRFSRKLRVRTGRARTLQAVARGGKGLDLLLGRGDVTPLAFTNPVYLAEPQGTELASQTP